MNKRYLGAAILAPFVIFIFLGGIYLRIGIGILSILGLYEFYKTSAVKGYKPFAYIGYLMTIIYYLILNNSNSTFYLHFMLVIATLLLLSIPVVNTKYNYIDGALTVFGFIYVAVFFSFIVKTNTLDHGKYYVWLIFISSWLCDTSAYYVGRIFGKHKLCPQVSPKKTIEGSIGGLLGSSIACGIFGFYLNSIGVGVPVYHLFIIGLVCGIVCQFGDLAASSIKRFSEVKDYSNLIPGHGGILDRFDSILFASVVVYYYIVIIINTGI